MASSDTRVCARSTPSKRLRVLADGRAAADAHVLGDRLDEVDGAVDVEGGARQHAVQRPAGEAGRVAPPQVDQGQVNEGSYGTCPVVRSHPPSLRTPQAGRAAVRMLDRPAAGPPRRVYLSRPPRAGLRKDIGYRTDPWLPLRVTRARGQPAPRVRPPARARTPRPPSAVRTGTSPYPPRNACPVVSVKVKSPSTTSMMLRSASRPTAMAPDLVLAGRARGRAGGGRLDHVGQRVADRHELGHALQQAVERLAHGGQVAADRVGDTGPGRPGGGRPRCRSCRGRAPSRARRRWRAPRRPPGRACRPGRGRGRSSACTGGSGCRPARTSFSRNRVSSPRRAADASSLAVESPMCTISGTPRSVAAALAVVMISSPAVLEDGADDAQLDPRDQARVVRGRPLQGVPVDVVEAS